MRKMLMAMAALFLMAGLVVAGEVVLVKYDKDKKEVTVTEDGKEKTYKVGEKVKFSMTDKDGKSSEAKMEDFEKRVGGKKSAGAKFDIKTDKDEITEVMWKGGKK